MPDIKGNDRPEAELRAAYVDRFDKMRYMDGSPVEDEYAQKISAAVSGAADAAAMVGEDELEAYAAQTRTGQARAEASKQPAVGPENPGITGEKVVPDWMIEKYRAHNLSAPIEDTGWLFHDDSWNNRGMVVIASTTRPVIKEFPYQPNSGTDHMRSKARALVYASQRPETPGGFVAPAGELVSEPVYPRARLGAMPEASRAAEPVYPRARLGGGSETAAKLAAVDQALEPPKTISGPSL